MDIIGKNSILVVDDDSLSLCVLDDILSKEYTVYTANGGVSALELADKYMPDLIILDILMPDMNGFEVLTALKKNEKTRHIAVIIISGLDNVEDEENGLGLGAADFIHKPFSYNVVKSRARHQIQIVNQIRAIEEANRSKSSFLAKMSHEIRTPLNAVLGIAGVKLQNETLQPDIKEAFTRIFNSSHLLLSIINDILDMSKIEAGKLELIPVKYDIASMINGTVFLNMVKCEHKPIEFILNVDENVPSELFGDELRIKQILNNLLSNAFKYTKEGEVELSLNAEYADTNTVTLIFRIRDTGLGMTPDQLSKLFDEYSRFNMEANRTTEGTGLGMGIAQNLIHMMGGEITAESEAGKGSLFTVRLPQTNTGASPLGKETADRLKQFRLIYESKMENIQIVREPIPFGKVLVVDDMEMNIYVAKEMLSPYGLQIDVATSGYDAIEKVKANVYDVVFMDHMMPIMDGVEAVGEIRKLGKEFEKLPIVALTANAVSGMKEMFLANGFNDFISKPIVIQELDAILKKWMTPEKITERKKSEAADDGGQYDSFINGIAKIREINTEIGLNQAGSKGIYYNTLDIFYKKLLSECGNMTAFLEAKDMHAFTISVHAMKSMLAIIGAATLSETAIALETASKNGDVDFCMQQFGDFKGTLLSLHKQLSAVFQGTAESLPENTAKAHVAAQETPATKKVLLVDDTEMVLFITKGKLSSYGLQVDTATSGLQAITKIKDGAYDLVFMDHMMPEMDGVETAREIRKLGSQYEKLPIVALTANVEPGVQEFFLANGFNGFLSKPIVKEKLENILEKWMPKTVKNP